MVPFAGVPVPPWLLGGSGAVGGKSQWFIGVWAHGLAGPGKFSGEGSKKYKRKESGRAEGSVSVHGDYLKSVK